MYIQGFGGPTLTISNTTLQYTLDNATRLAIWHQQLSSSLHSFPNAYMSYDPDMLTGS